LYQIICAIFLFLDVEYNTNYYIPLTASNPVYRYRYHA